MSLVRVQTVWTGVAGSPYYTNIYAIGPITTNNGNDMATAWRVFLNSLTATLANGLVATIDPEILEFNEVDGTVTGAGTTTQAAVVMNGGTDRLPPANQLLIRWSTAGIVHNRRVRGRTFLPGAQEGHNDLSGNPAPAIGTPVTTGLQAYLTTMAGRARIWAQPHNPDPADPNNPARPGSQHAITGFTIAPYWAVLRSRRD